MKLLSFNCNGIRSALSKGLKEFLEESKFDIISFQEVKAMQGQFDDEFLTKSGYKSFIFPAEKKGYSGTAVYTKLEPISVKLGTGNKLFDSEGRIIQIKYKDFTLFNIYFPSGTSGEERQKIKMEFLSYIFKYLNDYKKKNKNIILCGDINIAHTIIDIHDPKGNAKNSGFLPEEREWVSKFLESGWVDTFRHLHPDTKDIYSWWTYRFKARSRNKGWRIDYFFTTDTMKSKLKKAGVHSEVIASDHAPIYLELV